MAVEFRLPELGENIDKVEVISLLVSPGDRVEKEQGLLEMETDKAAMELPSPVAGIVKKVHVAAGDTVSIGGLVVTLEAGDAATDVPTVSQDDPEPKADTEKPVVETPAPARVQAEKKPAPPSGTARELGSGGAPPASGDRIAAGPATRRLARELGVDLVQVTGSGPRSRIIEDDLKRHVRARSEQPAQIARESAALKRSFHLPDFSRWGEVERQPFRSIRKKTATHMSLAWSQVPHVTQHDEADVTDLEALRKLFRGQVEAAGGKLTPLSFIIKCVTRALREFPFFNSTLDLENEELILKKYINIGIAVETERGLLVPVLRDADRLGMIDRSVALTELAEKARQNQLKVDEMQGGTFTITNLGGIGGTGFTPIVNFPEVAILGVSRTRPVLSAAEDYEQTSDTRVRLMMPLSLSYDHRVIDGAAAARFVRFVAEHLESPGKLVQLS